MDRALKVAALAGSDATVLASRISDDVQVIGEMQRPRPPFGWRDELAAQEPALRAAADAEFDVLVAAQCNVAMATLPRVDDDAAVLWLDAHGDLNTPDTSGSQYLGGMPLAAAIGAWDPGLGLGTIDPARLVMSGMRDLDPGEEALLARERIRVVAPGDVPSAVAGRRLFIHLDVDVLSSDVMPAAFPAPGGLSAEELSELLARCGETSSELVGLEVTAFDPPDGRRDELADTVAGCIDHLLEAARVR